MALSLLRILSIVFTRNSWSVCELRLRVWRGLRSKYYTFLVPFVAVIMWFEAQTSTLQNNTANIYKLLQCVRTGYIHKVWSTTRLTNEDLWVSLWYETTSKQKLHRWLSTMFSVFVFRYKTLGNPSVSAVELIVWSFWLDEQFSAHVKSTLQLLIGELMCVRS